MVFGQGDCAKGEDVSFRTWVRWGRLLQVLAFTTGVFDVWSAYGNHGLERVIWAVSALVPLWVIVHINREIRTWYS
jgi:hypothetical protein